MIQNTYKTTPQDKPAQKPFFTRLFSIDRRYRIIIGFLVQGTALFYVWHLFPISYMEKPIKAPLSRPEKWGLK